VLSQSFIPLWFLKDTILSKKSKKWSAISPPYLTGRHKY
jgi:hypothetical protein